MLFVRLNRITVCYEYNQLIMNIIKFACGWAQCAVNNLHASYMYVLYKYINIIHKTYMYTCTMHLLECFEDSWSHFLIYKLSGLALRASETADSTEMQQRRKRVVLTIEDKLDILKLIDKSVSYHVIAEKYSIGKSTVGDIKKNRDKIMKFQQDATDMGMKKKAKTMKLGEDRKLEEALYIWFRQKRMEGAPVSGPMLQVKARELNELLQGRRDFTASDGWKWRFCQCYGIRQLSMQGEKLSSNEGSTKEFVEEFRKFFHVKQLSLHQVFNCNESGLNYRLLPEATLAVRNQKNESRSMCAPTPRARLSCRCKLSAKPSGLVLQGRWSPLAASKLLQSN